MRWVCRTGSAGVRDGDHRVQRDRSRRGAHRGCTGVLQCARRFRAGLGDRGVLGGGRGLAVSWTRPEARGKTTLRIIAWSSSPSPPTSPSSRCGPWPAARPGLQRRPDAGRHLVVMPVLSGAQRRAGRELGSGRRSPNRNRRCCARTCRAVVLVGLAVNSLFGGPGRTGRGAGDRRGGGPRGIQCVAG